MATGNLIAALGAFAAVVVPLQGATFAYVVSIERRLTRLETLYELTPRRQALPEKPPVVRVEEADREGVENLLELGHLVKTVAHCAREECYGLTSLPSLAGPAIVPHQVGRVHDRRFGELGRHARLNARAARPAVGEP